MKSLLIGLSGAVGAARRLSKLLLDSQFRDPSLNAADCIDKGQVTRSADTVRRSSARRASLLGRKNCATWGVIRRNRVFGSGRLHGSAFNDIVLFHFGSPEV